MKKLILSIAIAVFTTIAINAQVATSTSNVQSKTVEQQKAEKQKAEAKRLESNKKLEQQNANPNAPVIEFDKLVHDYGTIEQHADGNCEFTFTNTGKEPLILSNVRASWGCTVPAWPRQPVLPGQSDVIKVKYDTKRVGNINKSIRVVSNAKNANVTLKIKGKILAKSSATIPEKKVDKTASPVNK